MTWNREAFLIVWVFLCLRTFLAAAEAKERHKRELKFPRGGSFVAAVALTSFLPKGPTDGLAHVLEFDLGFPFPEQLVIGKKEIKKKNWTISTKTLKTEKYQAKPMRKLRRKRNLKEQQIKNLRIKIEDAITRYNDHREKSTRLTKDGSVKTHGLDLMVLRVLHGFSASSEEYLQKALF